MPKRSMLMPLLLAAICGTFARPATGAEPEAAPGGKLKVLVVYGGHGFPVEPFAKVFAGFGDMDCTLVEEKQGGEAFEKIDGWDYDAIVLYNYMKKPSDQAWKNFNVLLEKGTGLVILHHAIYGYRPRPEFMKIVGVTSWLSAAKHGYEIDVHVADPQHPITRGLKDFTIHDEVYQGHGLDPKCHVLLTTDNEANAKWIAWVHRYAGAPVCYFQLGHDAKAYVNESFQTVLGRAIRWVASAPAAK